MADIKVERRRETPWGWIILGALAVVALAWIIYASLAPERPLGTVAERGVVADEQGPSMVVSYRGEEWVPADVSETSKFADEEMIVVGEQQGVQIFAHPAASGGGGGAGADVQPYERIFLKMDEGSYLPMVRRSEVER